MVLGPQKLVDLFPANKEQEIPEGSITTSYANFGLIPYGHSMIGRLHFDKTHKTGCDDYHKDFLSKYDAKVMRAAAQ